MRRRMFDRQERIKNNRAASKVQAAARGSAVRQRDEVRVRRQRQARRAQQAAQVTLGRPERAPPLAERVQRLELAHHEGGPRA